MTFENIDEIIVHLKGQLKENESKVVSTQNYITWAKRTIEYLEMTRPQPRQDVKALLAELRGNA